MNIFNDEYAIVLSFIRFIFVSFRFVSFITKMVVTRSSAYSTSSRSTPSKFRGIFTTSAKEAAIKGYKVYTTSSVRTASASSAAAAAEPVQVKAVERTAQILSSSSPSPRRSTRSRRVVNYAEFQNDCGSESDRDSDRDSDRGDEEDRDEEDVYDEEEAANTLLSLNDSSSSSSSSYAYQSRADNCVNPMTPVVRYAYNFTVSDPSQQQHFVSCYMMYDEKTRHFHLLNKITLLAHNPTAPYEVSSRALLTKYTSYSTASVEAYIFNLLATPQHGFCISAQFIGLILSDDKLRDLYDANACYYDIDSLIYTKSSTETTTGDEFFTLTPPTIFSNDTFTKTHIHCVFDILSGNK